MAARRCDLEHGKPYRWPRPPASAGNEGCHIRRRRARSSYDSSMSSPPIEKPDLPEYMTWEELERLPEELAEQIELWNGRVVWVRRGPREHQRFTRRLVNEIERCAREYMSIRPESCWEVESDTNVFMGTSGKSDFSRRTSWYTGAFRLTRMCGPPTLCWLMRCCRHPILDPISRRGRVDTRRRASSGTGR